MDEIEIRYLDHSGIPNNSRVCLYGIGTGGTESLKLLRQIRSDVEIIYFADTYQSGSFKGIEILSPQALVERKNEYDLILVCSCYYPEIIKHLHSLDINNVAGFSWPKFYGYQFLPDEIVALDKERKFILENLHSESDRALYKFLFEARRLGSDHVQLSSHDDDWAYLFKENKEFSRKFSVHIFHSYFDFVNLSEVEYVVQAGVYDGSEALFLTGLEQIEMLYGFDPQGNTAFSEQTLQMLSDSKKFTLIAKGLWNSEAIADFAINGSASFVKGMAESQNAGTVQLTTLNQEAERLAIPRLDFLIADIENSEIPMLEGAMEIIERDRPQLAICFYHSKDQFLGVPLMLMKHLKDYVFKIGHYSKGLDESVFYAIPKEKFNK